MFCSSCGKTIHAADTECPHCHAPIGDNRFRGIPYTSAQFTIAPGQTTFGPVNDYTRTTYTSRGETAEDEGEVDSRTTYRPVYKEDNVPQDVKEEFSEHVRAQRERKNIEKKGGPRVGDVVEDDDNVANFIPGVPLSKAAQETLSELDEELKPDEQIDRSQFMSRPIQSNGRAGISQDVSDYIRHLEDTQNRKAASRRRSQEVYDDYAAEDGGEAQAGDENEEKNAPREEGEGENYDEGEDDGAYDDRGLSFRPAQIIKIAVALLVIAALVFGIVSWIRYVRGKQSSAPIEGVSEELYTQGLELIRSHVDSSYIDDLVSTYTTDGAISTSSKIEAGKDEIRALLSAEPAANDQTFVDALLAIQDNIGNAVIMDGLAAVGQGVSDNPEEDSQANWQLVNNSIAQLEGAKSAAELTAIINGQTISIQSRTPEPTQEVQTYSTLSRGDENNDVMELQVRLYNLGYLNGSRDGVYGSKTATAVGLFQQTAGLEATGIADNETQQRLYADDAPYAPGAATQIPTVTQAPTPEPTEEMIEPAEATGALTA